MSAEKAQADLRRYSLAMRRGQYETCEDIEEEWGLYGYPPEIVSTVLSCVGTGLTFDAALNEATGSTHDH